MTIFTSSQYFAFHLQRYNVPSLLLSLELSALKNVPICYGQTERAIYYRSWPFDLQYSWIILKFRVGLRDLVNGGPSDLNYSNIFSNPIRVLWAKCISSIRRKDYSLAVKLQLGEHHVKNSNECNVSHLLPGDHPLWPRAPWATLISCERKDQHSTWLPGLACSFQCAQKHRFCERDGRAGSVSSDTFDLLRHKYSGRTSQGSRRGSTGFCQETAKRHSSRSGKDIFSFLLPY